MRANPGLRGTLFDLPSVVEGAPALLAEAGVADRCEVVGGDMFEAVPGAGDLYVLSRVVHDWEDARAAAVLRNCRRAMHGQARLILVERVLPDRVEPVPAAQPVVLSDLNMMVRTGWRASSRRAGWSARSRRCPPEVYAGCPAAAQRGNPCL